MTYVTRSIDFTYLVTTAVCCAVFVAAAVTLCVAVFRDRGQNSAVATGKRPYGSRFSEIIWTVIPVAMLLAVFFATAQLVVDKSTETQKISFIAVDRP